MQKYWNASRHFTNTLSLAVLLAICTVAAAIGAAELSKQQSLAELEGTWTLVTANMSGQPLLAKDQQPPEITIKNGILTSDFKRASSELPLDLTKVVDPFKSPKIITLPVLRRITFNGIYEVRDAELRVCGGISRGRAGGQSPTDFSDNEGVTLVFRRAQSQRN